MISLNLQPIEKVVRDPDAPLEIFKCWETCQGEGPLVGAPSVFVRTAGCILECPFCLHGNTSIRMGDFNTKLISEIKEGDVVLSYDVEKLEFVSKKVLRCMSRETWDVYKVNVGGNKMLYATGEHPVLVRDKGWVKVESLQKDDHILQCSVKELMKLRNPMKRKEVAAKVSATMKEKGVGPWQHMTDEEKIEFRKKVRSRMLKDNPMKDPSVAIKGFLNRKDRGKITSTEKFMLEVGKQFDLVFIGDGSLVVDNKAPDFIIAGTKKLVDAWDASQTEHRGRDERWMQKRREGFAKEGYEVLFLPVTPYPLNDKFGTRKKHLLTSRRLEIDRVQKLLSEYVRNGAVVKEVIKISPTLKPKAWAALAGDLKTPVIVYNLEVEGTHTYIANSMIVHNCDTDYTSNRDKYTPDELVSKVQSIRKTGLVVLTGGEPMRQPLARLIRKLVLVGYQVQIETNGLVYQDDIPYDWITTVCSPKTSRISEELKPHINALKYVLGADDIDPNDGLPTSALGMNQPPCRPWTGFDPKNVYVQPLDVQDEAENKRHLKAALDTCFKYGYRFSLQQHKLLGLE